MKKMSLLASVLSIGTVCASNQLPDQRIVDKKSSNRPQIARAAQAPNALQAAQQAKRFPILRQLLSYKAIMRAMSAAAAQMNGHKAAAPRLAQPQVAQPQVVQPQPNIPAPASGTMSVDENSSTYIATVTKAAIVAALYNPTPGLVDENTQPIAESTAVNSNKPASLSHLVKRLESAIDRIEAAQNAVKNPAQTAPSSPAQNAEEQATESTVIIMHDILMDNTAMDSSALTVTPSLAEESVQDETFKTETSV